MHSTAPSPKTPMPRRLPQFPSTFRLAMSLAVCADKKNRNNFSAPRTPRVLPAPPSARVAPAPAISGKLTVVIVKPGDSLWKFAASRLGDGRRWQELLSLNPGLSDPNVLKVGSEIVLPSSFAPPRT